MIVAVVSVITGQRISEQKTKLKFRPPSEWFANMQPPAEQSLSYFEQNEQPAMDGPFQDLYLEDYEPEADSQFSGGSKFARHPTMNPPVFQPLCPTSRTNVFLKDPDYEYRPSSFVEVRCKLVMNIACYGRKRFSFSEFLIIPSFSRLVSIWSECSSPCK